MTTAGDTAPPPDQPAPGHVLLLPPSQERLDSAHWEVGLAVGPDAKACHQQDGYAAITFIPHGSHVTYLISVTRGNDEQSVSRPWLVLLRDSIPTCTARPVDPTTIAALFAQHGDPAITLLQRSAAAEPLDHFGPPTPLASTALADVVAAIATALTR